MRKRLTVSMGVLALSAAMFGAGYWVAVKRMERSMNVSMGYLSYSLNKVVISDARMDGLLLESAMMNDSKKTRDLLQKKYYGEVLALETILQNNKNLATLLEGEPLLAKQYVSEIQFSAQEAHSEAAKRLKRYPFQFLDEQGNDRLENLRRIGLAER